MAYESNLFSKAEQAAYNYLVAKRATDGLADLNIFTGQSAEDKSLPAVIVAAEGPGEEEPAFTGNFWFILNFIVRCEGAVDVGETAATVKTANDDLVKWVFDSALEDDLPTQLSLLSQFTCIAAVPQSPTFSPSDENAFDNTLSFRIYACCKDI